MEHADLARQIIRSVGDTLRRAHASTSNAEEAFNIDLSLKLLGFLNALIASQGDAGARHDQEFARIVDEATKLLGPDKPAKEAGQPWRGGTMLEGLAPPPGGISASSVLARLGAEIGQRADTAKRTAARDLFRRFIALEENAIRRLDPGGGGNVANLFWTGEKGNDDETAEKMVNEETLTAYLKAYFPNDPNIRAVNVRQLVGGMSKDTTLFEITGSSHDGRYVMRKDAPVPRYTSAIDEFSLLRAMHKRGVPVPEPVWSERDTHWFGGAFIVVKFVPGANDISGWVKDKNLARRFGEQLARVLVQIHAVRPADVGLTDAVGKTATEAQIGHMNWLLESYRTRVQRPNPRIEAAFGWLLANVPQLGDQPPSLVHCGMGFHNLLTENGNLNAVLDWEFTHFGDPGDDLGYIHQFIERVLPWPEFLAMYKAQGGAPYTDEQDRFYAVWRSLRNACACMDSYKFYVDDNMPSVKLGTIGLIYGPRFELSGLREVANTVESF